MKSPRQHSEEIMQLKSLLERQREPGEDDEPIKPYKPKANLKTYILTEEEEAQSREAFVRGGVVAQQKYLRSIGKYD